MNARPRSAASSSASAGAKTPREGTQLPSAAGVTLSWLKSSFCADGTCLEAAGTDDGIVVRDAKNVKQPVLRFEHSVWLEFLEGIKAGDFRGL
jgi:uncharacterized protein DUF397